MKVLFDQGPVDGSSDNHEPEDLGERSFTSLEEAPESLRPPRETRTPGWANALMIDDAEFIDRVLHYNLMNHPMKPLPDGDLKRKDINDRPFLPSKDRRAWAKDLRPQLIERADEIGSSDALRDRLRQIREKIELLDKVESRSRRTENMARRHQSQQRYRYVQRVREYLARVREFYILKRSVFRTAASRIESGLNIKKRPDRNYERRLRAVLKHHQEGKGVVKTCRDAAAETGVGERRIRGQLKKRFVEYHELNEGERLTAERFGNTLSREAERLRIEVEEVENPDST